MKVCQQEATRVKTEEEGLLPYYRKLTMHIITANLKNSRQLKKKKKHYWTYNQTFIKFALIL